MTSVAFKYVPKSSNDLCLLFSFFFYSILCLWQRTDLRAMYAPAPSPRTTTCGILSSASTQIRPVPTS